MGSLGDLELWKLWSQAGPEFCTRRREQTEEVKTSADRATEISVLVAHSQGKY